MSHDLARVERSGWRGTVAGRQRQRWRMRPTLMALEDRRLLSTIVVNNPTDTPIVGQTDLRQAIVQANTTGGNETITFDKKVFKTPQTMTLTGGQLELSDTTGTETITGPKKGVTVNAGGLSRVFLVDGSVTASISGMTITGGQAGNQGSGGGLFNIGGASTTLTDVTISGNSAVVGGGVANSGSLTADGCFFDANHALSFGGAILNNGHLDLLDSGFTGNSAGSSGGAVSNSSGGSGSISGCNFSGNHTNSSSGSALGGGGIAVAAGALTIANTTIIGNSSAGIGGGVVTYEGSTTLTNCTVSGDSSSYSGGGLFTFPNGSTTLTNCTVSGNSAGGNGGGLADALGTTTLTNCTVSGNSAVDGGGLLNHQGTMIVSFCKIINNQAASDGGGIGTVSGGGTTITDSVINANQANSSGTALGGGIYSNNSLLSLTNCTVNANQAIGANAYGGGIYALDSTVDVQSCTVNGNQANGTLLGEGGGIYSSGSVLTLVVSTVKGNKATTRYADIFAGP